MFVLAGHIFSKKQLENIFNNVIGKTLGEVDRNNVFDRAKTNPKITGIAGDVIEQSVLGYRPDSIQSPDLFVDGKDIELKTTGIRKPKKKSNHQFEAKEPMSITAVSTKKIAKENFETSKFWHKLERSLLVYYHYDSNVTVKAIDYANFVIKAYQFHEFSEEDKEILKNDWTIVRDFIKNLQKEYDIPENEYHRISSELRKDLMFIDIAPKWPNRPRFRLKRTTVSNIVQKHFGEKFEELSTNYSTFRELDEKLHLLTELHHGKTIKQLMLEFSIPILTDNTRDLHKSISEQIVVRMFGAKAKKISKIELFNKIGIIPKTVTQTKSGTKTEDTKLCPIDFTEWTNDSIDFEESSVFNYFNNQQFLCILFEEPSFSSKLQENKFLGFKRLIFQDSLIKNDVRNVWNDVRELINKNQLKESIVYKKDGEPTINKTGELKTSINFPKSRNNTFFIRGSGIDSAKKTLIINGISMYQQNIWVKGKTLVAMLKEIDFI
ncbi:MutH/Sau3AI family endonuclease [Paenisporosarcina macmurdoensis]|uniref:MutH/Sau3AI family endonuclease n=1 Tax=Paenisporosarcina macmurdoensis TaxID=212659 RepID=A0ABW1L953_9BACL